MSTRYFIKALQLRNEHSKAGNKRKGEKMAALVAILFIGLLSWIGVEGGLPVPMFMIITGVIVVLAVIIPYFQAGSTAQKRFHAARKDKNSVMYGAKAGFPVQIFKYIALFFVAVLVYALVVAEHTA